MKQLVEEMAGTAEVVDRLDERNQADIGYPAPQVDEACFPGQDSRLQNVVRALGHRDYVALDHLPAVSPMGLSDGVERAQRARRGVRQLGSRSGERPDASELRCQDLESLRSPHRLEVGTHEAE